MKYKLKGWRLCDSLLLPTKHGDSDPLYGDIITDDEREVWCKLLLNYSSRSLNT